MKKKDKNTQDKTVKKVLNILPLGDRVLIRPFTEAEASGKQQNFGIILPESMTKEKSARGMVLAVGEGWMHEGKLIPIRVKAGDTVIFSKYGYDEVEQNGEELYLLKQDQILAVIK